ncbi:MAG: hypothetical protein RIB86_25110 [Imperialibacter sp.]
MSESSEPSFRLDKTAFRIQSFAEADDQRAYWLSKSDEEKLKAATYLILSAYGLLETGFPPMDKNVFSMEKRNG